VTLAKADHSAETGKVKIGTFGVVGNFNGSEKDYAGIVRKRSGRRLCR